MATKVVKFGGSSLADAKQIQKAAAIIARHEGLDYKELETITIE